MYLEHQSPKAALDLFFGPKIGTERRPWQLTRREEVALECRNHNYFSENRPRERVGPSAVFSSAQRGAGNASATPNLAGYVEPSSSFGVQQLSTRRSLPRASFGSAPRSERYPDEDSVFATPGPRYDPRDPSHRSTKAPKFGTAPSIRKFNHQATIPGPKYELPSTVGQGPKYSFASAAEAQECINCSSSSRRDEIREAYVGFGYGCSAEEHALYGRCLDGRCSQRARWERRGPSHT